MYRTDYVRFYTLSLRTIMKMFWIVPWSWIITLLTNSDSSLILGYSTSQFWSLNSRNNSSVPTTTAVQSIHLQRIHHHGPSQLQLIHYHFAVARGMCPITIIVGECKWFVCFVPWCWWCLGCRSLDASAVYVLQLLLLTNGWSLLWSAPG